MQKISTVMSRGRFLGAAVALTATALFAAVAPAVSADQVTNRSLTLSSSASGTITTGAAGSSTNGQEATYTFRFNPATATGTFKSFQVMFCATAFGYADAGTGDHLTYAAPCAAPTGMDATTAASATVSVGGGAPASWTVDTGKAGIIRISDATGATWASTSDVIEVVVTKIKNPTTATYTDGANPGDNFFENTFFGHMDLYSDDAYTVANIIDDGTVASAITKGVGITARVQETLKFSVGTDTTAATAYCNALDNSSNALTMGDANGALSFTTAYDANSYFRVSTNSANGTSIQYAGSTLTSGPYTIDTIGAGGSVSAPGNEQFGLNIDHEDADYSFTDLAATGAYANVGNVVINGVPAGTFAFVDTDDTASAPQQIASSPGGITCDTGSVRYLANIDLNTESGIYKTNINYIAVPKY